MTSEAAAPPWSGTTEISVLIVQAVVAPVFVAFCKPLIDPAVRPDSL